MATVKLIWRLGGKVCHAASVVSLENLGGKKLLSNFGVNNYSLVVF